MWLSRDPLGYAEALEEGSSPYSYVGNDPVNHFDVLGLCGSKPETQSSGGRQGPPKPPKRIASGFQDNDDGSRPKNEDNNIENLRRAAVRKAWAAERQLVEETGQGTRNWTDAEIEELLENGKVSGYHGHHINSVASHPELAANPNNIQFLTRAEHFEIHDFNWQNPTSGPFIPR